MDRVLSALTILAGSTLTGGMLPGLGFPVHNSRLGASLAKVTSAGPTNQAFPIDLCDMHTPRTFSHPTVPYARLVFGKGLLLRE